jgi:type I restriction enzyme S subunit
MSMSIITKQKTISPKLRFKGFDDSWRVKHLGELLEFKNGINASKEQYGRGIKFINVLDILNNECITYDSIIGSVEVDENVASKYPVNYGDILFQRSSETREEVGTACVYLDRYKTAVFGGFVIRGRKIGEYDPIFLNKLLKTDVSRNEITSKSGGSTRYNVGQETLSSVALNFPTLPEQQKIACFLSAVDEKIQQLNRKKELLEQYKKGVIQQLFSDKLNFKDENGKAFPKWEEKRLDEVVSKFIVPMRDKPKDLTGLIPWCRIEDFDGKYLSKSKSGQGVDISTIKEMNLKVYPIGTLLVSCSANLGFCAITTTELVTNQTFIGLVPDEKKVDVLFLFYVMRRLSVKLNSLSSGTTISYLSREQFERFKVPYPCLLEQKKLIGYISSLDDKIDIVDKQIAQTQTFKKGLLQQMFV